MTRRPVPVAMTRDDRQCSIWDTLGDPGSSVRDPEWIEHAMAEHEARREIARAADPDLDARELVREIVTASVPEGVPPFTRETLSVERRGDVVVARISLWDGAVATLTATPQGDGYATLWDHGTLTAPIYWRGPRGWERAAP